MTADEKHSEIMKYLKILVTRVNSLETKLVEINMRGFKATCSAFHQMKEVTQAIVDETRQQTEDLACWGGVIESESFFDR